MSDTLKKKESAVVKKLSFFERLILGNSVPKVRKKKVIRKVVSETPETVPSKELSNSSTDTEQKDVIVVQDAQTQSVPEEIIAPIVEEVIAPKLAVAELSIPEEVIVPIVEEVVVPKLAVVEVSIPEEIIVPVVKEEVVPKLAVVDPIIEEEKPKELIIKKLTVSIVEDSQNEREEDVVEPPALVRPTAINHGPVPFDESALFVPLRSVSEDVGVILTSVPATPSEGVLPESEYFYLGDGKALTSLYDFLTYVESLSDEDWKRSVHDRKSNFVIWIETVFGTGKLARLIELADSQKEAVLYIRSFLGK